MSGATDREFGSGGLARALFPDLALALDAALARNGGGGEESSLDRVLDAAVSALPSAGFGGEVDAPGGLDRDTERSLLAAIADARAAFDLLGLRVPTPEAVVAAGVDTTQLGRALRDDPELVPVLAPHGLPATAWLRGFADTAGAPALFLASEIEREFEALSAPPAGVARVEAADAAGKPVFWTFRAIPSGEAPAVRGLSHAHGPHPTIAEILALQLVRAAAGLTPVDQGTFTWLDPQIGGGRLAARHVYDVAEHAIRISAREIGSQGPHLGARPPR